MRANGTMKNSPKSTAAGVNPANWDRFFVATAADLLRHPPRLQRRLQQVDSCPSDYTPKTLLKASVYAC